MNNKQKLHQIKLTQWAARFQEQAASGLTVKVWCAENNVRCLKKFRCECYDVMLSRKHGINVFQF